MSGQTKLWIFIISAILAFIFHPSTEYVSLTKIVHVEKRKVFNILKDPYGFLQLHPYAVEVKIIHEHNSEDNDSVVFDVLETIQIGNTSARIILTNDHEHTITLESKALFNLFQAIITWELSISQSNEKETFIRENFVITAPWIARSKVLKIIKDAHIQMLQKLDTIDTTIYEQ